MGVPGSGNSPLQRLHFGCLVLGRGKPQSLHFGLASRFPGAEAKSGSVPAGAVIVDPSGYAFVVRDGQGTLGIHRRRNLTGLGCSLASLAGTMF